LLPVETREYFRPPMKGKNAKRSFSSTPVDDLEDDLELALKTTKREPKRHRFDLLEHATIEECKFGELKNKRKKKKEIETEKRKQANKKKKKKKES
jgi:hypothetical protein